MTTDEKVAEAVRLGGNAKIEDLFLSGYILRAYFITGLYHGIYSRA